MLNDEELYNDFFQTNEKLLYQFFINKTLKENDEFLFCEEDKKFLNKHLITNIIYISECFFDLNKFFYYKNLPDKISEKFVLELYSEIGLYLLDNKLYNELKKLSEYLYDREFYNLASSLLFKCIKKEKKLKKMYMKIFI